MTTYTYDMPGVGTGVFTSDDLVGMAGDTDDEHAQAYVNGLADVYLAPGTQAAARLWREFLPPWLPLTAPPDLTWTYTVPDPGGA
jgi:hypothetical protein